MQAASRKSVMKIGVLSDTHIPYAAHKLPSRVYEILATVDVIIHAGDFQQDSVIDELKTLADFFGVYGNMDPPSVKARLPAKEVLSLGGFTIGLIHGGGTPHDLVKRVLAAFANESLDALIYGHSHTAHNELKNGILLFNPGSPTDTRFAPFQSMGVLTLEDKIQGDIIHF